jgi:hypothetical protein
VLRVKTRARHRRCEQGTHSTKSFLVSSSLFFLNSAGVMLCAMIVDGAGAFGGGGGTFSSRALPTAPVEALGTLSLLAGVMGGLKGWGVLSSSSAPTTEHTTVQPYHTDHMGSRTYLVGLVTDDKGGRVGRGASSSLSLSIS